MKRLVAAGPRRWSDSVFALVNRTARPTLAALGRNDPSPLTWEGVISVRGAGGAVDGLCE